MKTLIPVGASVAPFERKMAELGPRSVSEEWYDRAVRVLRGGDGGEHGLLLYQLILHRSGAGHPLVVLDVGTARGFSAMMMARAMLDANMAGHVYTVDVIDHDELRGWHVEKQEPDEPLARIEIARSEIWNRWFGDEAARITAVTAQSSDVLDDWKHGPVDLAFLDGSHTYASVKRELSVLDCLMAGGSEIVLDDYHLGVSVARVHSRPLNAIAWVLGRALPPTRKLSPVPGESNEYVIVKQRFYGIRKAVSEFLEERDGQWSLEIISMPSRGEYQGSDYSLAALTKE